MSRDKFLLAMGKSWDIRITIKDEKMMPLNPGQTERQKSRE
jgi:hypothetical protein